MTIVVSDAEDGREWSEHDLGDSYLDCIDSHETPRHQMGLRTSRCEGGGTGRLFRISRVSTEEKGTISLFWGFRGFLHDVIFDFKFCGNHTAGSEESIHFVAAHGSSGLRPYLTSMSYMLP